MPGLRSVAFDSTASTPAASEVISGSSSGSGPASDALMDVHASAVPAREPRNAQVLRPFADRTSSSLEEHVEEQVGNAEKEDEDEPVESFLRLDVPLAQSTIPQLRHI
jgi:hypothetical protein